MAVIVLLTLVLVLQLAIWRSVVYRSGQVYDAVLRNQSHLLSLRVAHDSLHTSHREILQVRQIHPTRGPVK